jgi:hypothetical protein
MGAAVGVGQGMSQFASQAMGGAAVPPPLPQETQFFVFVNNQQLGGQTRNDIAAMLMKGVANGETLAWKPGMAQWDKISNIPELSDLLGTIPPPLPPMA